MKLTAVRGCYVRRLARCQTASNLSAMLADKRKAEGNERPGGPRTPNRPRRRVLPVDGSTPSTTEPRRVSDGFVSDACATQRSAPCGPSAALRHRAHPS
jgi:hypothetical protein